MCLAEKPDVCDVVLGGRTAGINGRHFCITFHKQRRPILRDSSKIGTTVSYNGQCIRQRRHNFTWIFFEEIEDIEVFIGTGEKHSLRFGVQVESHSDCAIEYEARLNQYLIEAENTVGPISNLHLRGQESTAINTELLSPKQTPIYFKDAVLGQGVFGVVHRAFDVSTGFCYAEKTFFRRGFEKEVEIMRKLYNVCKSRILL